MEKIGPLKESLRNFQFRLNQIKEIANHLIEEWKLKENHDRAYFECIDGYNDDTNDFPSKATISISFSVHYDHAHQTDIKTINFPIQFLLDDEETLKIKCKEFIQNYKS